MKIGDQASKVWNNQNQIFVVGNHLITKTLRKVHSCKANQVLTQHVYIAQHIQLGISANNSIMQTVIVSPNRKVHRNRKSLVEVPTHPPLYCNEKEIEGFDL